MRGLEPHQGFASGWRRMARRGGNGLRCAVPAPWVSFYDADASNVPSSPHPRRDESLTQAWRWSGLRQLAAPRPSGPRGRRWTVPEALRGPTRWVLRWVLRRVRGSATRVLQSIAGGATVARGGRPCTGAAEQAASSQASRFPDRPPHPPCKRFAKSALSERLPGVRVGQDARGRVGCPRCGGGCSRPPFAPGPQPQQQESERGVSPSDRHPDGRGARHRPARIPTIRPGETVIAGDGRRLLILEVDLSDRERDVSQSRRRP